MRVLFVSLILLCFSVHAEESIIARAAIPNRLLKQGEMQLVAPDNAPRFIRIELSTRHLSKVEKKIVEKETLNWPDSPDSLLYLEVLHSLCTQALASGVQPVVLSIQWHPDRVSVHYQDQQPVLTNLSPEYLKQNLLLIARDGLDLSAVEAQTLLTPEVHP
ncbi:hypothetical protein P3T73_02785 [Kiritimatiellota bacterium B12222]|nr:hypothetical protein P3T73_02785 [Kiritimatiellota bacterium B12222]